MLTNTITDNCESNNGNVHTSYEGVNPIYTIYDIISAEIRKNMLQNVTVCKVCYSDLISDDSFSGSYDSGRY